MRPEDLPRGFADNHGLRLDYLRWKLEYGPDPETQATLEREERDGFSTLLFDPEPGRTYDCGIEHYGEFICSLDDGARLLREGAEVDVVTRYMNGVQMRYRRPA